MCQNTTYLENLYSITYHPCGGSKYSIISRRKFIFDQLNEKQGEGGNSSGKTFLATLRSILFDYHEAAMTHLDFNLASCRFNRITISNKVRRLFFRISSTVVERILASSVIRSLSHLSLHSTFVK